MKKRFQKPKNLVSFMLVLAIMTTSFAIPNNVETVKAETVSVNPTDYDEYVDYLEALVTSMAGKKVAPADYTNMVSGTDENGNLVYYTYLLFIEQMGYVIPSDCTQILVDLGNFPYIAYKSDGTKVVVVKTDGYNVFGYNEKGYDRIGNYFQNGDENVDKNDNSNINEDKKIIKISKLGFNDEIIRDIKSHDYNKDGYLSQSEIDRVTILQSDKKITNTTGIEYFTNLKSVSFGDFRGTKIDLSKNKKCKRLWIERENKKASLIINAPSVKEINITTYFSKTIDISKCKNTVYLHIMNHGGNATLSMPSKNKNLRYIYLWNISNKTFDFNKYSNLQIVELPAMNNKTTSIKVNKCKELVYFWIDLASGLKSLDFSNCSKLKYVHASRSKGLNSSNVKTKKGVVKDFKFHEVPQKYQDLETKIKKEIRKNYL